MGEGEERDCYYAKCLNELRKFADAFASPIFHTKQGRTKNMGKHRWTYDEDYLCCEKFIQMYCVEQHETSITPLLEELSSLLPNITVGSIRMKIQNIKEIAMRESLYDILDYAPLAQYTKQCKKAFDKAIENVGENTIIYIIDV